MVQRLEGETYQLLRENEALSFKKKSYKQRLRILKADLKTIVKLEKSDFVRTLAEKQAQID